MTVPVLVELEPGDGRVDKRNVRDQAIATMTALAPMTRIIDCDVPIGSTATVSRHNLGPVDVVHLKGFDYDQVATAKTTDGVPAGISLAVRPAGTWHLSQAGTIRSGATNDVVGIVDVTRPMSLHMSAETQLSQLYLSADQLGMSVDALRASAALIERSPLRSLVAHHVLNLTRSDVDVLNAGTRQSLGAATIELVRAMLIGSARPQDLVGTDMSADHILACTKRYVRQHLRDPALDPAKIARAHAISLRSLYHVWRDERVTIARWIVLQRLAAARESLANPALAHKSIATVSREWCLENPTYFSRRFREQYGLTPREWRRIAGTSR